MYPLVVASTADGGVDPPVPTSAHSNQRPVIVISNADRPYGEQEATVVCLTTQTESPAKFLNYPGLCSKVWNCGKHVT